jgi:hypothetical protein
MTGLMRAMVVLCAAWSVEAACHAATTEMPRDECGTWGATLEICDSNYCKQRNSTCKQIVVYDYVLCGCVYCNYDEARGQCSGECADRLTTTCLNKVAKPASDADCECYTCKNLYAYNPHYGFNTIVGCDGDCLASGKQCRLVVIPNGLSRAGQLNCICWDESSHFKPFQGDPLNFGVTEFSTIPFTLGETLVTPPIDSTSTTTTPDDGTAAEQTN